MDSKSKMTLPTSLYNMIGMYSSMWSLNGKVSREGDGDSSINAGYFLVPGLFLTLSQDMGR
jgi:hypothetical protein